MEDSKSKIILPEEIRCFKCGHDMTRGEHYIGESSNIWPIGQMYHCDFCCESVGVTQDGRVTYWSGQVIGLMKQTWELTKEGKEMVEKLCLASNENEKHL